MRAHPSLLVLLAAWTCMPVAAADIYRWFDAAGNVHYSDTEPADLPFEAIDPEIEPTDAPPIARSPSERAIASHSGNGPCFEARVALDILHARGLVYRTADGRYRAASADDDYHGPREYLSDAARPQAIEEARGRVREQCGDPASFAPGPTR